jgi:Bifunctional DNA primase/polymerase, N-terminal
MTVNVKSPPLDPWEDGVRAADVPIAEGGGPNPLLAPTPGDPIVEHAVYYAGLGWYVFPAPAGEKKSHKSAEHSDGRNWGMTTDADEIRRDFKRWPSANIGIVTGEVSGIFVVETDTAAGHGEGTDGAAALAILEAKHGRLPSTRMAISPSGSVHRYFAHPGNKVWSRSGDIAPGVDCKGDGGMVVAPPSIMPARAATADKPAKPGGAYRWLNDLRIAPAPQWLLDIVCAETVKPTEPSPKATNGKPRSPFFAPSDGESFFSKVNANAMTSFSAWVPALCPKATLESISGMRVWRVTSAALGRNLQEDLSFAPNGIFDFGTREGLTPIDAVMKFSSSPPNSTATEAAFWLCERMEIAPKILGWKEDDDWIDPSPDAPDPFIDQNKASPQPGPSPDDTADEDQEEEQDQETEFSEDQSGAAADSARPANEAKTSDDRPAILIKDGELSSLSTRAEEILIAAGVPIYQRSGALVRPIIETVDATRGRKTNVAQLKAMDAVYMRDLLGRHAFWGKYNERKKKILKTNPPQDIAITVMARVGDWIFPAISGVISTPTMRPDGSLLTEQGYDKATGLLLVEPPPMPAIPDQPTREDALKALEMIEGLLVNFPFVDEVAHAVALSAILTPIVRGAFPVTPLHASRAPTAGSGKSFLWDIAAAAANGQCMPVISTGANEEETEKRLGAALLAGQPLISIDNITGELGGAALCQMIERPVMDIRILGRSELVRIEARGTSLFATGNNFVIVGDVCRRVITTNLDPAMEQPELRQFDFDPVERVLANRGQYIAAALTICRAYLVAGRPNKAPRLASFEGWSDMVRSALIWLGKEDPVKSMENARAEDPERIELSNMLDAWSSAIGIGPDSRRRLSDVLSKGLSMTRLSANSDLEPTYPEFYVALEDLALRATGKRGQKPDAKMFGDWLRRFKGRVIDGKRFANKAKEKGGSEWWVEEV